MVDGKPTRSVLTALCQRVAMRLGEIATHRPKKRTSGLLFSHGQAGCYGCRTVGLRFYLRWAQSSLFVPI